MGLQVTRNRSLRSALAVYVCLCNALTDRQVKAAAEAANTTKPSEVYAACGCRAQCGNCIKRLLHIIRGDETQPGSFQEA
ncbi:MAG TPA: (2Fe-2S)-binding protein [Acidisoma sp.]|jgi:bacterioferritin-associated ferredoxin|uniref:(2Fe-2S)-binding protein n=1 Tax=Acidisoma sp. TaxID=1872115 RepID=UPI002C6191D2|nr:(2Fe-2S)-binding protein [Acidisoma sp.]HTI01153.1 (2Fe-2S)-binding protein [Acidisoma sp.]